MVDTERSLTAGDLRPPSQEGLWLWSFDFFIASVTLQVFPRKSLAFSLEGPGALTTYSSDSSCFWGLNCPKSGFWWGNKEAVFWRAAGPSKGRRAVQWGPFSHLCTFLLATRLLHPLSWSLLPASYSPSMKGLCTEAPDRTLSSLLTSFWDPWCFCDWLLTGIVQCTTCATVHGGPERLQPPTITPYPADLFAFVKL